MPVKLSDDLVQLARAEAEAAHRSIASQVEHWARLGRAVETVLLHEDALAVKQSGGNIRNAFEGAQKRESVLALLDAIASGSERGGVTERIGIGSRSVYGTDPRFPGMVVRVNPDGTRTPGRFESRRFVPAG
jgi:hypothetical protein